jgi:hypothetical protein
VGKIQTQPPQKTKIFSNRHQEPLPAATCSRFRHGLYS